jgi:hypothetical protein
MSGVLIPDRDSSGNVVQQVNPFASKSIKDGKLFRRLHGYKTTLQASGETIVEITVPYIKCKINELEPLWFPEGITVDLEILDTANGIIQQSWGVPANEVVPNLMLNQFAFGAGVAVGKHIDKSEYDADLIQNMKIKMTFHNPTETSKEVCMNITFHEVKS